MDLKEVFPLMCAIEVMYFIFFLNLKYIFSNIREGSVSIIDGGSPRSCLHSSNSHSEPKFTLHANFVREEVSGGKLPLAAILFSHFNDTIWIRSSFREKRERP